MQNEPLTVDALIAMIKDRSDKVRAEGWTQCGQGGGGGRQAVGGGDDLRRCRSGSRLAARRALWRIVHYVGRPGGEKECAAVLPELHGLLADAWPEALRREVLWMLSEIGSAESVPAVAACLKSSELLEDARCALERIPGEESLAALKEALIDRAGEISQQHRPIARGLAAWN